MPGGAGQRLQNDFLVEGQRDPAPRHEQMGGLHPRLRRSTCRNATATTKCRRGISRSGTNRTSTVSGPARSNSISISTPRRPARSRAFRPITKSAARRTAGCGWVPEFIHFCDTNHAPVDFVSTHTYGVESGFLDETATAGTALSRNPNSIFGEVKWVRQQIAEFGDAQAGTALHRMEQFLHAGRSVSRQLSQRGLHSGQAQELRRRRAIHVLLDVHGHLRRTRPALGSRSMAASA